MAKTVGDFIVERVRAWGVQRVFGYPGDGINGIMAGFEHLGGEGPRFIQARHEELAAFMAGAHAKFTGDVGVCLATSGPGAIHLLNGLYDAAMDHQPVVAIVGQAATTALGGEYQQEVDLQNLFKDVAHNYVATVANVASARHCIDRAFRIALSERCVTCVIVPKDLQEKEAVEAQEHAHNTIHSSAGWSAPRVVPKEEDLKRAAEVLNAGSKVAMLVGAGAMRAADEVVQVADVLGAGIAKALLGKGVLPDDTPGVTGSIGLLGTKPSWEMMKGCDTLLMVGSSFPYSEFLPKEGQARGVQIDLSGRMLGIRYPMEVNLQGDAAETLRALLPYLKRKKDRGFRQQLEAGVREWREILDARAHVEAKPLNPALVFHELNKQLPDRAIFSADSGSTATWYARYLDFRPGMMGSLSGNLATMGPAMPYAVAAKFAYEDRPVFALAGDGAMQMNGLNALITVQKYWRSWKDPRFVVLVLNNRDLNMVTWELRAQSGEPKFEGSQELPDFPFAAYAESLGLMGLRVDSPDAVAKTWEVALRADRPVLVEAVVDPEFPMMPPHVTLKEAKAYARALLRGEPEAKHMIGETIRTAVAGVFEKGKKDR
ncbi:MAG TPA: thiamine pyrophosphate-requiring protein [Myxococcales bacterium]|jgi:pyruvate dehydrogenase (quinone)|nr:thiamine pyrophosphate-requiring protein [Myxococcales bacterium]